MKLVDKISFIQEEIISLKSKGLKIGFVPTMGSLHPGHLSLIEKARSENDRIVVSIFVNPTQFNNADDLKNYPRNLESDLGMMIPYNVDIVFAPLVGEMYPAGFEESIADLNLGSLETVMEGKMRPGHFKGVVQVVSKLFRIVQPDSAYFGEKDFQQLSVIRFMTEALNFPVKIIACPTIREADGLAMSSRNVLLTSDDRTEAARISKALFFIRDNWKNYSVVDICYKAKDIIETNSKLVTEYLVLADPDTLQLVNDWTSHSALRCFTAVKAGKVRLIDNVGIFTRSA